VSCLRRTLLRGFWFVWLVGWLVDGLVMWLVIVQRTGYDMGRTCRPKPHGEWELNGSCS